MQQWSPSSGLHSAADHYQFFPAYQQRRAKVRVSVKSLCPCAPRIFLPPHPVFVPLILTTKIPVKPTLQTTPRRYTSAIDALTHHLTPSPPKKPMGRPFSPRLSLDGKHYIVAPLYEPTDDTCMNAGVHTVQDPLTGVIYVQKLVRVDQHNRKKALKKELEALHRIRNAGAPGTINKMVSYFHHKPAKLVGIILEYSPAGTLADLISRHRASRTPISSPVLFTAAWSLACALSFLHYGIRDLTTPLPPIKTLEKWNGILHLDVKPENIFLRRLPAGNPNQFQMVLGDFGCSVTRADIDSGAEDRYVQAHGTNGWFPPENSHSPLFKPSRQAWFGYYGRRTDVWQAGGVVQCSGLLHDRPSQEAVDEGKPLGEGRLYGPGIKEVVTMAMTRVLDLRLTSPAMGKLVRESAWKAGVVLDV